MASKTTYIQFNVIPNTSLEITSPPLEEYPPIKRSKSKKPKEPLQLSYNPNCKYEIGIDEAGRGPLFGRLYVAGVILPKDGSIDFSKVRDSKKISAKKRKVMSDFIKENAISYHIHYAESSEIDQYNIRECVLRGMKECAKKNIDAIQSTTEASIDQFLLMVDGNDFPPMMLYNDEKEQMVYVPHETFVGGDNKYTAIAAASILAKVARDEYIMDLCERFPLYKKVYGLDKNMGYGTKQHLEAIQQYGITKSHRLTYGICKNSVLHAGF